MSEAREIYNVQTFKDGNWVTFNGLELVKSSEMVGKYLFHETYPCLWLQKKTYAEHKRILEDNVLYIHEDGDYKSYRVLQYKGGGILGDIWEPVCPEECIREYLENIRD